MKKGFANQGMYTPTLASLDVKDAFLQVPQERIVSVQLSNSEYAVLKILPGQRIGARAWYWFFRRFTAETLGFEWNVEQPCLAKSGSNIFMMRVDDLLFCGDSSYWKETFIPAMQSKFKVSFNELKDVGSSINFLKRTMVKLDDGIMIFPGTKVESVAKSFGSFFGPARVQKVPCDSGFQQQDQSEKLLAADARKYRSVIGHLMYLCRVRADLMFCVKELATHMASPTLCALQRMRKVIGYLKGIGNLGIKLGIPEAGSGKVKRGCEHFWCLETFADADWSSNKSHRRSTSGAVRFMNGAFMYGSARSQKVVTVSLSSCESELRSLVSA